MSNVPKILEEIDDAYRRDGTAARIIAEERAQRTEGGERGERARGRGARTVHKVQFHNFCLVKSEQ
jgi:hypothetical protein